METSNQGGVYPSPMYTGPGPSPMYNSDVAPKADPSAQAGSAHKALDEIVQQKNMMRLEIEQLRAQLRERDDLIDSLTQHTHSTVNS